MGEGARRDRLTNHRRLTEEVGIGPARWQAERGATMRCIIDRIESPFLLRAFPYAEPNAPLPSGRELKFRRAKAKA